MGILPSVVNAEYVGDFRVRVLFNDGTEEVIDIRQWLEGPIFEPLKDVVYFRRFFVEGGTITWPNGADIAPETLYDAATHKAAHRTTRSVPVKATARSRDGHRGRKRIARPKPYPDDTREIESFFQKLTEGRESFWRLVRDAHNRGDVSHEDLIALVDLGLQRTKGSYRKLAELFHVRKKDEYLRLMDFLRRSGCLLDFRPYRKAKSQS